MSNLNTNTTSLQAILDTVNSLPEATADPVLQSKTVTPTTAQQNVTPDSGYDGLSKVTVNAMPTATQATPSITINSNGLITATATQTSGYVASGTKSATKQLAFQAAKTITPTTTSQVAVSSGYYTGGSVIVAAIPSSYVQPSGTKTITDNGTHDVKSYANVEVNVASGGAEHSVEDSLVDRTIRNYVNDRVFCIGAYAFYYHPKLNTVSCSVCTKISTYAFYKCSVLMSVNFPACISIYNGAFSTCSKLSYVSFPACTNIGDYGVFQGCTSLVSANFPACVSIGSNTFSGCSKLSYVSFPELTTIGSSAFYACSNLQSVFLPKVATIYNYAFRNCSRLTSLTLGASTVCTLNNSSAFSNAGIKSTAGSIFVPASLVDAYKSATNWTYFSNRIYSFNDIGEDDPPDSGDPF